VRRVRLEPIGAELECAAGESVLEAAFRQGLNLVHGCREGQCSACKCFLLEGEVALKRYSSFALSDSERSSGYSLMCRAVPESDLVVELLHYDPANLRLEHAIADGEATIETIEPLTGDITRLVLRAKGFSFTPGQYVDVHVPDGDGARRSFSMANMPGEDRIELMIKRYPGGRLSGLLDGRLEPGDKLGFTGPYGAFRLRESARPILMIAGGSGMAPILSLLRQLAGTGWARPVRFFYGARTESDLFHLDEIERLGAGLGDFRFTPVVQRFVHEAVDEHLAGAEIAAPDVYMCGPPPMIDAAQEMLAGHGIDEDRIFTDKFTASAAGADAFASEFSQSAASAGALAGEISQSEISGPAQTDSSERDFAWFTPHRRRASLYEDVTIDTQPSVHRHIRRGWPVSFADGRGTWDEASTALRSGDWYAFRDPGEQWERTFYQQASAIENQIETTLRSAAHEGLLADFTPTWVEFLRQSLQVPAYVEHGLWFALATVGRDCLSDSVATCVCLQAAMKQRSAQALVLYAMDLEAHYGPFSIEAARERFLGDERWQPTRRYLERLAATPDWGEVIVAANLCFEPRVGTLLRRELGIRAAAASGDTVTPVLARAATQEWEWARAWTTELIRMLLADPDHGAANRAVIDGWVADWTPEAVQATRALGGEALLTESEIGWAALPEPADRPLRRTRPTRTRRVPASSPAAESENGDGGWDYVGIVMAKSAEGDAVAEILARRDGIEVIEQPAFWDIRARVRLAIPYADVSDQLGYDVDAYSIQHEMSTHYGRMVATDEALMLFSDPTDAMQYLMS
jgi:ferredoxin-NADP reductase/ferredoxin